MTFFSYPDWVCTTYHSPGRRDGSSTVLVGHLFGDLLGVDALGVEALGGDVEDDGDVIRRHVGRAVAVDVVADLDGLEALIVGRAVVGRGLLVHVELVLIGHVGHPYSHSDMNANRKSAPLTSAV